MSFYDWITSKTIRKIERTGELVLIIVSTCLFLDYRHIINLSQIWSLLSGILWCYLLLNVGLANIIKFWRSKDNPLCPKCKKILIKSDEYECIQHGKLKFEEI